MKRQHDLISDKSAGDGRTLVQISIKGLTAIHVIVSQAIIADDSVGNEEGAVRGIDPRIIQNRLGFNDIPAVRSDQAVPRPIFGRFFKAHHGITGFVTDTLTPDVRLFGYQIPLAVITAGPDRLQTGGYNGHDHDRDQQ